MEQEDKNISNENTKRGDIWSRILMIVAVILAYLFYSVFPMWLDIQEAGGFEAWINDTESILARILLFFARIAM